MSPYTDLELERIERVAEKRIRTEAFLAAHPEYRSDMNMISDKSEKPVVGFSAFGTASAPTLGVVDQMAADRATHIQRERDSTDATERVRAAALPMLDALRSARRLIEAERDVRVRSYTVADTGLISDEGKEAVAECDAVLNDINAAFILATGRVA